MPCSAACGRRADRDLAGRRVADDLAAVPPAPRSASRNSSWPWPSRPARPTSSPARTSRSIGARVRPQPQAAHAQHRRAAAVGDRLEPLARVLGQLRRRRSSGARARAASSRRASSVATVSPERMTVMRSPISLISSMRCVMKITPTPSRARRADASRTAGRAWRRRARRSPRRGSGSRGSRSSARTMQQAWRSLSESSSTGMSRSSVAAEQLARASRRRARASRARDARAHERRRCRARRCRAPSAPRRPGPPGRP